MATIRIGNRTVGTGNPVFVVAELSGNHRRNCDTAALLVMAAANAGADAVKTQMFTPDSMTLPLNDEAHRLAWRGQQRTLYDLYAETAMPLAWHEPLKKLAESLGLIYFASVFDQAGIDLGESIGLPVYKIASFEATDLPLIRAAARTGKPIILSTGMATLDEIIWAMNACCGDRKCGKLPQLAILKCTTAYPATPGGANLRTLASLRSNSGRRPIGLSDHTRSNAVVCAAVALGASIVERHLTLCRANGGPDAAFSDEPEEFGAMVSAIRETEAALGTVYYGPTEAEKSMLRYRRSLWIVADVAEGEAFTSNNVCSLRPIGGMEPRCLDDVLGRVAARDCRRGEPLMKRMVR